MFGFIFALLYLCRDVIVDICKRSWANGVAAGKWHKQLLDEMTAGTNLWFRIAVYSTYVVGFCAITAFTLWVNTILVTLLVLGVIQLLGITAITILPLNSLDYLAQEYGGCNITTALENTQFLSVAHCATPDFSATNDLHWPLIPVLLIFPTQARLIHSAHFTYLAYVSDPLLELIGGYRSDVEYDLNILWSKSFCHWSKDAIFRTSDTVKSYFSTLVKGDRVEVQFPSSSVTVKPKLITAPKHRHKWPHRNSTATM